MDRPAKIERIKILLLCNEPTVQSINSIIKNYNPHIEVSLVDRNTEIKSFLNKSYCDCMIIEENIVSSELIADMQNDNYSFPIILLMNEMPCGSNPVEPLLSDFIFLPLEIINNSNTEKYFLCGLINVVRQSMLYKSKKGFTKSIIQRFERYHQFIDEIPILVIRCFADDYNISYVNTSVCDYFGREKFEMLGANIWNIIPSEEHLVFRQVFADVRERKEVQHCESNLVIEDNFLWLAWTIEPMCNDVGEIIEFHCIGKDITEVRMSEVHEHLFEEWERLHTTLKSIRDGIITTDVNRNIIMMNNVAEEITGYNSDDAIGKAIGEVFNVLYQEPQDDLQYSFGYEPILTSKDGNKKSVAFSITAINDRNGKNIGDVIVFRDLTEKRLMEVELYNQKEYFQSILESQDNMIIVADKNEILHANQKFVEFFGFSALKDLKGKYSRISDLLIEPEMSTVEQGGGWIDSFTENSESQNILAFKVNGSSSVRMFSVQINRLSIDVDRYVITFSDVTKLEERSKDLEEKASFDMLTKIYNRRKFDEIIVSQIEISKRYNFDLSLIFFDIDHFKRINDTYGHQVGDYILQDMSNLVSNNIRKADILARWGGEEFIMLLPQTGIADARIIADKIKNRISSLDFKQVGNITCSFGLTELHSDDTVDGFIGRADKALYKAKRGGRNRIEFN